VLFLFEKIIFLKNSKMTQNAIITGGSQGLGKALCNYFLQNEWNVATCSRSLAGKEELMSESAGEFYFQQLDVRDPLAIQKFVDHVHTKWDTIDLLINNASVLGPMKEIEAYTNEEWQEVVEINLNGTFYFTKAVLPFLKRGSIILNISSGAAVKGKKKWGAYAASKFGLEGFTQVLQDELVDKGIRVHSIDPGAMQTSMRRAAYPEEDPTKNRTPEQVARVIFDIAVVYEPQLTRLKVSDYF